MKEFIRDELILSRQWTDKILSNFPEALWKISPEKFKTNINWQVGHLIISTYFHSILSISGSDEKVKQSFNPREYSEFYGMGSNPLSEIDSKDEADVMLRNLKLVDERSLEILDALEDENLEEKTLIRNPMAKIKKDALIWTFKHQMWHNGQMALIISHFS